MNMPLYLLAVSSLGDDKNVNLVIESVCVISDAGIS
jgi:hypothetical protein